MSPIFKLLPFLMVLFVADADAEFGLKSGPEKDRMSEAAELLHIAFGFLEDGFAALEAENYGDAKDGIESAANQFTKIAAIYAELSLSATQKTLNPYPITDTDKSLVGQYYIFAEKYEFPYNPNKKEMFNVLKDVTEEFSEIIYKWNDVDLTDLDERRRIYDQKIEFQRILLAVIAFMDVS